MANRCGLYIADIGENGNRTNIKGFTEWSWDVPVIAKLFVSSQPEMTRSLIFDSNEKLALQGDIKGGVENMKKFIERLRAENIFESAALEERLKALTELLEDEALRKRTVFVLEPAEIYEMDDSVSLKEANKRVFDELCNADALIDSAIAELHKMKDSSSAEDMFCYLGLCDEWYSPFYEAVTDRSGYSDENGFDEEKMHAVRQQSVPDDNKKSGRALFGIAAALVLLAVILIYIVLRQ